MNFEKIPPQKEITKEKEIKSAEKLMESKENSKHRFSKAEKEKIIKSIKEQK